MLSIDGTQFNNLAKNHLEFLKITSKLNYEGIFVDHYDGFYQTSIIKINQLFLFDIKQLEIDAIIRVH